MTTPAYQPRDPSSTLLYRAIAEHLETFLDSIEQPERLDYPNPTSAGGERV